MCYIIHLDPTFFSGLEKVDYKGFFRQRFGSGSGCAVPASVDERFSTRSLLWLLLGWMCFWSLLPSFCLGNVSVDVAENIAWGQNFDWGYDKNPYFGAWFSFAVFKFLPTAIAEHVFYWVGQLSVLVGLFAVHLIAREIFEDRFSSFITVVSALLIPSFSNEACEFNDDILCIALYGLTALFFLRGVKRNDPGNWLAFGLCAGLAVMTKYLAGVLLLPLGILVFATPEGRKCLRRPWIYLGGLLAVLLILPNVIWLIRHDFAAVTYAFGRARLDRPRTLGIRLGNFFSTWGYFLLHLLLPTVALLIFRRGVRRSEKFGFEQWFVLTVAIAPTAFSSLFALMTGGRVMTPWMIPYYLFVTLPLVMFYRPCPEAQSLRRFWALLAVVTVSMAAIFCHGHLYHHLYRRRSCNHNVYPGREIADMVTAEWHRRFGRPCPYVIGTRKPACNMCYYSPDHPRAFFEHDIRQSLLIDPADIKKRGAVVLWESGVPGYLGQYGKKVIYLKDIKLHRAAPWWMRFWAPRPPALVIRAALIQPEP